LGRDMRRSGLHDLMCLEQAALKNQSARTASAVVFVESTALGPGPALCRSAWAGVCVALSFTSVVQRSLQS